MKNNNNNAPILNLKKLPSGMSFDTANDRQGYEVRSQSNTHKSERSNDERKRFTFSGP